MGFYRNQTYGYLPGARVFIQKKMLKVQNLSFTAGNGKKILDSVSLEIHKNEIVGLVGGSGSGKSTIFYSLFQPYYPDKKGTITGKRLLDLKKMQPVFQDAYSGFNPNWKMSQSLMEPLTLRKIPPSEAIQTIQSLVSRIQMEWKDMDKKPDQFSGGQLQRLAILRAILCEPEYLIMDEPVSGLDPLVREKIIQLILEFQKNHELGILFISHDLDVVAKICDRVYVLQEGKIIEEGKMTEIPSPHSHPYTRELFHPWEFSH